MIVVLIGEQGTGRSKIAKNLAAQHGWEVISLDRLLQRIRRRNKGEKTNQLILELEQEIAKKGNSNIVVDDGDFSSSKFQIYDWARNHGHITVYVKCDEDLRLKRLLKRDGCVKAKDLLSKSGEVLKALHENTLSFGVIYETTYDSPAKFELFF